jgi:hypothetical protein
MRVNYWFTSSNVPGARIIQRFTSFQYSHVGIEIVDEKRVVDSTMFKGVAESSIDDFLSRYGQSTALCFDIPNPDGFLKFVNEQIGKPYDYTAIAAFPFARDWEKPDSWHCSELGVKSAVEAGLIIKPRIPKSRITPRDFYILLPKEGQSI